MDLTTVPQALWFEFDKRYLPEMAEKRRLLATQHAAVCAALPGSEPARQEALAMIAAALLAHHPKWFSLDATALRNELLGETWLTGSVDPLELAARLVQEDLCLIEVKGGDPILTAAVLCFPSRWRLAEKIGRPLAEVHGPVPLYRDRLARPVDRFMRLLKPGHIACRLNWSLLDDPALFQPEGKWRSAHDATITAQLVGKNIFLRVERQTLRRLPGCGAVLFGIRVHVYPLEQIVDKPETASALAEAVRALPLEMRLYKSLLPFEAALMEWLQQKRGMMDGVSVLGN